MIRREGGVGGGTGRGTTLAALVALMLLAGLTHYTVTAGKCHWLDFVNLLSSSSSTWDLPRWLWRNKEDKYSFLFFLWTNGNKLEDDTWLLLLCSLPGGFSHLPTYFFFFFLTSCCCCCCCWVSRVIMLQTRTKKLRASFGVRLGIIGQMFFVGRWWGVAPCHATRTREKWGRTHR